MDELTLRDYLKVIFRQKWVIIMAIITVTAVMALGLWIKTPTYQATVKMSVTAQKGVESPYYIPLIGMQNIQVALTQSEIVKSMPVLERTLKAIGLKPLDFEKKFASPPCKAIIDLKVALLNKQLAEITAKTTDPKVAEQQKQSILFRLAIEELKENVNVEPIRDTNLFTISYQDFDPGIAAAIANIISRSYVIFDLEQQLAEMQMKYGEKNLAVMQLRDSIAQMEKSLNGQTLPNIEAIGPASVKVIEQAIPPIKPTGLPKVLMLILAFFMSIFLGVMLAFGFDYMDQTFKCPEDIERTLNVAFLGSIPKKPKPNDYEHISDQLCFELKDRKLKSVIIAAAYPKEGVTMAIMNIAKSISNKCRPKVLVIDANLRKPAIHTAFKIANKEGLVDVLEGKVSFDEAVNNITENLAVLTSGKINMNPGTLLESQKMGVLIDHAKEKYEVVFVDCANLREAKDAIVLSQHVDSVVFIVEEGRTRRQAAQKAVESLRGSEALEAISKRKVVFLGAILGSRTFAIPKAIYERV
ncbi:MAG: polysaccharide biosynthesis tyrosine autokinase [Candidatus Omnitrophota bacterium]|jgi:capsular exopolysaccharide synthesis family protein